MKKQDRIDEVTDCIREMSENELPSYDPRTIG